MGRFAVPALLVLLLTIQATSLGPAIRRSRLSVVSVLYRAPGPLYAAALDLPELRRQLELAVASQGAKMSNIEPTFSIDKTLVTARFALESGQPREVAAAFGRQASDEAMRLMTERLAAEFGPGCADAVNACRVAAPGTASNTGLTIVALDKSRLSWLRPVDVVAALVYVVTLFFWLRRRTNSPARPPAR